MSNWLGYTYDSATKAMRVEGVAGAQSIATAPGAPPTTSVVAGAQTGSAAQAATDISGATVAANKVFQGVAHISAGAGQTTTANAAGTCRVQITWVPGSGGTAAQVVASVDLDFAANGATGAGQYMSDAVSVPLTLYAGTTGGKFQAASIVAGTITNQVWDVVVNGTAQ